MRLIISLILFEILTIGAKAQEFCIDEHGTFEVSEMQFSDNSDSLYVTLYNFCDTCKLNVYTGLIVLLKKDTLAVDVNLAGEWSPPNKGYRTYTLLTTDGKFDLSLPVRVSMLGVCDSIPYAPDVILGLKEESIKDKKKVILQSNNILTTESGLLLQDIAVYDLSGKLVEQQNNISVSAFNLNLAKAGMYLISVGLSNDEQVQLKYMKLE